MHPVAAWFIGAAYITYQYGYKCKMLPLPKRYIALTGFISIAALVAMADETVGAVFAYGSLLSMFLYTYSQNQGSPKCDQIKTDQQSQNASHAGSNSSRPQTPAGAPGFQTGNIVPR